MPWHEENYGSVLKDCSQALNLNPKSSKAYYRSSLALLALERFEECVDCCDRCLQHDPNNAVTALRLKALTLKEAQDQKVREKADRLRGELAQQKRLQAAFRVRGFL